MGVDIAPGTRLDAYEIIALLGRGGMGEVWLARDVTLDRKTAVKVLPASIGADSDRVARFRHEARVASALNHPNVCTIHMLGTAEDGQLFIAMEYIEGTTLRKRLAAGPLPTPEVIDIATQMASGLSAAHAAGVVHRDVKPENVMIRSDGLVKVLDFGLAKLDPLNVADSTRSALVSAGAVAGTLAYMSPEQATGESLDARTDIFSLGAVLYEMATGSAPFAGTSSAVVHDRILNRTPTSPVRLNREVPPRLEDLIMKALEKDRRLRYQTAGELKTDLMRLKRDSDSHAAAPQRISDRSAESRPGRFRSSRVAMLLALTFIVGLVSVIGFRRLGTGPLRSEWQEVQVTTNSSENPVSAAAISPDGRNVAYSDSTGIHLRTIDSGEMQTLAVREVTDINRVRWFPDGSKLLISGKDTGERGRLGIWSLALIGSVLKKLRDEGFEAVASPDGMQIAFVDPEGKQLWVMGANGEEPRVVVRAGATDSLHLPDWSVDGITFGRLRLIPDKSGAVTSQVTTELLRTNPPPMALLSHPGLRAGVRLPDGRWLYSTVAEPSSNRDSTLWETQLDRRTLRLEGARRLREWPGAVMLWELTATNDGNRVAFMKRTAQRDVYIADVDQDGTATRARRLTLDDSDDFPASWTHDGASLFFTSNRNGSRDIFRQSLESRVPEAIVTGPEDEHGPMAVSPDGAWLYYLVSPRRPRGSTPSGTAVWRTALSGGARDRLTDDKLEHMALCARSPSAGCVLVEREGTDLSIYSLDPERGRGRKITSTPAAATVQAAISPDGSQVAVLMPTERRIRVVSLAGTQSRDVPIAARLDDSPLYWSVDGNGWFVSSTTTRYPAGTELLHVDLDGRTKIVWRQIDRDSTSGIPAPDGRHIALTQTSTITNVWMLKSY
jgi:serine/threonine protein kinase